MTTAGPGPGSLLAQPAYPRLWRARTVSHVGDVAQFTTLALLLTALTGPGSASPERSWPRSLRCCYWRRSPAASSTDCRA